MIVLVNGTKSFSDYNVFMRAMGVALASMHVDDREFYIYAAGPSKINSMASEFCNLSERGMKSRGMKIKKFNVSESWILENLNQVNYCAYFKLPHEKKNKIIAEAELQNLEVGVFSY